LQPGDVGFLVERGSSFSPDDDAVVIEDRVHIRVNER
jgi:hypothetical protein